MWKLKAKATAACVATAVSLASGPALAWDPTPAGPGIETTVTTIVEVGLLTDGAFLVVAEALPADCPHLHAVNPTLNDKWLGILGPALGGNPGSEVFARYLSLAMFARAQNVRVRVTIGGVAPNSQGCYIQTISTCFDANNCVLPAP